MTIAFLLAPSMLVMAAPGAPPAPKPPQSLELDQLLETVQRARELLDQSHGDGTPGAEGLSALPSQLAPLERAQHQMALILGVAHPESVRARLLLSSILDRLGKRPESDRCLKEALQPFHWLSRVQTPSLHPPVEALRDSLIPELRDLPLSDMSFHTSVESLESAPLVAPWMLDLELRIQLDPWANKGWDLQGRQGWNVASLAILSLRSPEARQRKAGLRVLDELVQRTCENTIAWGGGWMDDISTGPRMDPDPCLGWAGKCALLKKILEADDFLALWPQRVAEGGASTLPWRLQEFGKRTGVYRGGPEEHSRLAQGLVAAGIPIPASREPRGIASGHLEGRLHWSPSPDLEKEAEAFTPQALEQALGKHPDHWDQVWKLARRREQRALVIQAMTLRAGKCPHPDWHKGSLDLLWAAEEMLAPSVDAEPRLQKLIQACAGGEAREKDLAADWRHLRRAATYLLCLCHQRKGDFGAAADLLRDLAHLKPPAESGERERLWETCPKPVGFERVADEVESLEQWTPLFVCHYERLQRVKEVFEELRAYRLPD